MAARLLTAGLAARRLAWLAPVALLLGGCAALPWPSERAPQAPRPAGEWLDLRGVVHVHTEASHDSPGSLEAVIDAARSGGISWVALTEHTRPGIASAPRTVDGVTLIPGFEINSAGGTILALGLSEVPPRLIDPAKVVRFVHERGALAFVGHFEKSELVDPEAYRRAAPDGIEILNLHAVALRRRVPLALRLLALPAGRALETLLQTPTENLARWSAIPEARAIVGSVDAHAKFRLLGPLGATLDRYRDMFPLLTTHVLARDSSQDAVLEALRAARSYVALEGLARVDRFVFEPAPGGFAVQAPAPARLALVCDGQEVASERAESARLAAPTDARLCRAEAWLGERLWIVTSAQPAP